MLTRSTAHVRQAVPFPLISSTQNSDTNLGLVNASAVGVAKACPASVHAANYTFQPRAELVRSRLPLVAPSCRVAQSAVAYGIIKFVIITVRAIDVRTKLANMRRFLSMCLFRFNSHPRWYLHSIVP